MDEVVGTSGTDIDFIDSIPHQDVDTSISIISSLDGHKKLLQINDLNGAGYLLVPHSIGSAKADATIEFYWAVSSITSSNGATIMFVEDGTILFSLYINANDLRTYNPDADPIKNDFITINSFFHVKLVLNDTANTFDCYINGVNEGTFNYRSNSVTGVDQIFVGSGSNDIIKIYFDAFGFSFDTQYTVGDNINGFVANGKYGLLANNPLLEQIGKPINRIIAYGIMNVATGERLKATANNESSQKLHGIIPFSVRAPHINNQVELDAFALTILSRNRARCG